MTYEQSIQTLLKNDSTLQGLLSMIGTNYAIFNDLLVPSSGGLNIRSKTINHYRINPIPGGKQVFQTSQTINCRAYTKKDAEEIQVAAHGALDRKKTSGGSFHCTYEPILPPSSKEDNYNAIISVKVYSKN